MQAHGFGDLWSEMGDEEGVADVFVPVVDAVLGGAFAEVVQHVADIVHQRGGDQAGRVAGLFGEPGGLQAVLDLVDVGQAVAVLAVHVEPLGDFGQNIGGHRQCLAEGAVARAGAGRAGSMRRGGRDDKVMIG